MNTKRLGLQKLTLLDYPGLLACTVFFNGCNFRCPFCHNSALVEPGNEKTLAENEAIMDFLKKRSSILDGVCFTGGEALLHEEIQEYAKYAKSLGYKVKIDTNGSFPDRLAALLDSGSVDYVAMDIKNSPEKYAVTCGNAHILPQVERSVELLLSGKITCEFRTTATGNLHEVSDFTAIGKWICGAQRYFIQSFVPSEDILEKNTDFTVTDFQLAEFLAAVKPYIPNAALRGK
ncbi:MAG: anaerobic ribonucleoside-triphosphate reductase activating protein [Lentisphaeria bacterium]|nr:anaerobic ribonucleoside-triphosphate reductase activating protein [Lentisphaeria bacterium]